MSDFNVDLFRPVRLSTDIEQKQDKVSTAAATKKALLAARQDEARAAQANADHAQENSWTGKLGLESGSFLGNRVNDVASLVSGAGRMVGDIASVVPNLGAAMETAGATEAEYAAYARYKNGSRDPYDVAASKQFENAQHLRNQGKNAKDFFDVSSIVDQTNRNELSADLGAEFESNWGKVTSGWKDGKPSALVSGIAGLLMNAGESVVTNPSAAREYIIENIPQLFTGALGVGGKAAMAASNVGYAADNYRKGLEEYSAKNGGALPPEAERNRMALYAASLAGAEQVGDMIGLGMAKVAGKGSLEAAKTSALQSLKNTLKAGGTAAGTEAVTEGYQTFAEGEVTGKEASALDIYTGAVIGGVAGAGLSGGGRALAELTKATPEHLNEKADEAIEAASFDAAVADNKPETFLDEASPTYDPAKGVAVLNEVSKKEGTSPEEVKTNLKRSGDVIAKLEKAIEQSTETEAKRTPEYIKNLETEIAQVEQAITTADPAMKADLEEELGLMKEDLTELTDKQAILQRQNRMTSLTRKLEEAREMHHSLARMTNGAVLKDDLTASIKDADSSDKAVSSKAGDVLLNLSMAAPDDLDPSIAKNLANNKNNGLTKTQRDMLRTFGEARTAELELKKQGNVSQEILFGQKKQGGNIGIAQYRTRIAAAVAADNKESAQRDLTLLGNFARSHAKKIAAVAAADVGDQIIKQGDDWVVNTGKRLSDKERRDNGAVNINANSGVLITEIRNEARALAAAHNHLSKAVALHFGTPAVQSVPSPAPVSKSMEKSVEGGTRLYDKPVQTEAGETQKEKSRLKVRQEALAKQEAYVQEQMRISAERKAAKVTADASPSATSPVAVSADATTAPATASATAEEIKEETTTTPEPEATEQQAGAPAEGVVAEVATAEQEDLFQDTGILSVMASRLESTGKTLHELFMTKGFNPVAQFLNQKRTSERDDTMRPLVKEKNFLTQWLGRKVVPAEFLGFQPDAEQQTALTHFATQARKLNAALKANIPLDSPKDVYSLSDLMGYMVGADGIDENTLTAMSYGIYHAMVSRANDPDTTPEKLNLMHGREKDATVGDKAWTQLAGVWDIEDTAVADLGRAAIQALGLTAGKNAPQNILPLLQTALGTHMITVMESAGLVERRPLNTKEINDSFEPIEGQDIGAEKFTMYIFPNQEALPAFKQMNKGTSNVVDKLFGADPAVRYADTKPAPFVQEFAQHTKQVIPRVLSRVLDKAQKVPHTVIPDMWEVFNGLGSDNILKVAGAKDPEDNVHVANIKGVEAKNKGLARQLELAMNMIGGDINQKFFVQFEVWKNFRVGVTTDSLNQQTSKIHRYLFARPSWTVTIDMNSVEHRTALEVAIAAGLGIKTDDQPNEETAELLRKEWNDDADLRNAVEAMHLGLTTGNWSGADAITSYAAGNEGMMTLQTLQTYARYQNADASGKLEVTLLTGADGKTNGPILTHLALGASWSADDLMDRMARGGMYRAGVNEPKHYSQWRKDSAGKDLYQDLASSLLRVMNGYALDAALIPQARKNFYRDPNNKGKHFPYFDGSLLTAIQSITGELQGADGSVKSAGRNLVKTPLTAFAFGSSLSGSIKAMEEKFIESIYSKIEELAADGADTTAFIASLNTLVASQDENVADMRPMSAKDMLTRELNEEVELALRAAFQNVMAGSVRETMESYFYTFIQRRSDLNSTIQAGFNMYEAAYSAAREQAIQDLMKSGDIAWRPQMKDGKPVPDTFIPLHDLTGAQEAAIREKMTGMLPVAHTAYSMGGDLKQGIYMAKQESSLTNKSVYQSVVKFVNRVKTKQVKDGGALMRNQLSMKAMTSGEISPGVAGTPYFIHSLDSALMHTALADIDEAMNVHDEIGHNVLQIARAAGAINRATVQKMLEFSPAREALSMYERIMMSMASGVKDGTVSKATAAKMVAELRVTIGRRYPDIDKETIAGYSAAKLIDMASSMALDNAVQADTVRLGALAQVGAMDQYVWEGGHYADEKVMASIRAKAQEKLDSLDTKHHPEFAAAVKEVLAFIGETPLPDTATVNESDAVPVLKITGADSAAVAAVTGGNPEAVARGKDALDGFGMTPWGEIGPSDMVDATIKAAFEKQPEMTRDQIVAVLSKSVTGANAALLAQAAKVLPANLKVKLVTPDTPVEAVLEKPLSNSRGWYVPTKSGQDEIYILSADFRYSGLNAETLVHELVHAALAREVHEPSSKASQSLVNDLTKLLEYVKTVKGADKFKDATKDVQEFLAWGLSNKEFQDFLKNVRYTESQTARNRLVTAMKTFTKTITGLLFKDVNDTKERALTVLITNAAGLFEAASAPRKSTLSKAMSHAVPAQDYSTADIYNALGQNANNPLSQEDDARLRSLLTGMVDTMAPIYGALGKDVMTNQTLSAASIWANAQAGGIAPFASDAVANGLAGNEQVAFMMEQVEVTMRAALAGPDGQTSVAHRELVKLYEEARTKLKDKIGAGITQSEYDFLFDMSGDAQGNSDYLSRFAALGLVNPKINNLLKFPTERAASGDKQGTFLERLQAAFEQAMEWIVGKWTRTHAGQFADTKLDVLAAQLVMIEAKRRARLNVERSKTMESVEEAFRGMAEKGRDKIDDIANSDFFKKNKNGFVRFAGSMTSTVVKDRLDQFALAYQNFSDQHFHHSQGVVAGLVTELRGSNATNKVFYKLLRMAKFLEGQRKDIMTGTAKVALHSFVNKGKDLKDAHKKAISNVFLRTDMTALLGRYDMKELRELLADQSKLAEAIVKVTEELGKPRHLMFYINASKALGYQMATGAARTANNLQNAYSIARLYGTKRNAQVQPNVIAHTEPLIDALASLYALQYTDGDTKADALTVFDAEMARGTEGNGVEMVLRLHKQLQAESKARLFVDQEALMMKGYTPEIYNPYIELTVVDKADVDTMKDQGFGKGDRKSMHLQTAKGDPEPGNKVLMARHGTGLQQHTTGTMSLTSMSSKGTKKHNGNMSLFSMQGQYNTELMMVIDRKIKNDVDAMFDRPLEPASEKETFMVPILNPQGEVVNYRYMMQSETKDNILDRDSRFEKLLGAMAGSIFDKVSTPKQNRTVVEALAEQYKLEGSKRPKSFIEVGPRSPDPEMREIYRLLPDSTKQAIREVWKSDSMHVRIDLLDMNFGYRKLSMADILQKDRAAREGFDKYMGEFLAFISTGKIISWHADQDEARKRDAKATVRLRAFEEVWQTFVKEAKDILVVKSVSTLIGNTMSNFSLLYGYGVPMVDVMRHHRVAFRGAVAYKRDSDELFALQTKLDAGMSGNVVGDKKRVVQLKDALAKNPVRELIEAGLMPTIVEDIELDDDIYSFKSKFVKRMSDVSDGVNPGIKTVAKQLYMAHDTTAYKALSQAAQLSDFLGRYTLYQHMTTKKRDPMNKEDAMQLVSDAFINYDVPTHRKMQYMNDMGFFRFTKYYLRVQKVIMHLYRDNPGRMLALMGMTMYFDQVPTLLDSSMATRFGNPLEAGAFTYLDAPENLATYKMMSAPFK